MREGVSVYRQIEENSSSLFSTQQLWTGSTWRFIHSHSSSSQSSKRPEEISRFKRRSGRQHDVDVEIEMIRGGIKVRKSAYEINNSCFAVKHELKKTTQWTRFKS
jgi:hypothetical protein